MAYTNEQAFCTCTVWNDCNNGCSCEVLWDETVAGEAQEVPQKKKRAPAKKRAPKKVKSDDSEAASD